MSQLQKPLFAGVIASGATRYVPVPIYRGKIGATIGWKDATSSATITLEYTDAPIDGPEGVADDAAGELWQWQGSGVSITGPAATAAGGELVDVADVCHRRARFKIVAADDSDFIINDFGGHEGY